MNVDDELKMAETLTRMVVSVMEPEKQEKVQYLEEALDEILRGEDTELAAIAVNLVAFKAQGRLPGGGL